MVQRSFETFDAFPQMAPPLPEPPERHGEAQPELAVARVRGAVEHGAQVVVLVLEAIEPFRRTAARLEAPVCLLCECEEVRRVPPGDCVRSRPLAKTSCGELADRLEHAEAVFPGCLPGFEDEALLDKRGELRQIRVADGLRRQERPAPREDGEAGEQLLLAFLEERVAPLDRRA
jgi:hypothetical protein